MAKDLRSIFDKAGTVIFHVAAGDKRMMRDINFDGHETGDT